LERDLTTTDKVQELQRKLYLKAKSEPKFRFYALYDKIYRMDVLGKAWQKVRQNNGSAGVDGKSIEDIETTGVEVFLKEIQEELRTETYNPQPAKRVYIPKPDGRKRPLSIPTIKDRVVQMALKIVIEPIFESGFEDNSYGYRPKRSAQQAVLEIRKYLNYGLNQCVDADLEDCFGSIPHQELLDMIAERILDGKVMRLIKLFLKAGVMEGNQISKNDKGTPQGGVISPLLANIYLDRIDKGWKPFTKYARLIRYADDLVILTEYTVWKAFRYLESITNRLKLKLSISKTKIINTDEESFDFLGYSFKRAINLKRNKRVAYFWPSKKAEQKIKARIKQITSDKRTVKVGQVVNEANAAIRGWVNYFKIGNSTKKFGNIRWYVKNRIRKFMMGRKRERGYGCKEYPENYLYNKLGLYSGYNLGKAKALR